MDFGKGNVARRPSMVWRRVVPCVPASCALFHQTVFSFFDSGFLSQMLSVQLSDAALYLPSLTRLASISSCIFGEMNRQHRSFPSLSMGHIGSKPSTFAKLGFLSSGSNAGPVRTISLSFGLM